MKRISFIFLLVSLFLCQGIDADDFSDKERAIIYTNAINVLGDYEFIINQMGNYVITDIEKARSSSESFMELFVNRQVLLYNDLDPSHQLSEFYEAETYASNILLWYPDGIVIKLDLENAKVSEIMQHEEDVYSIDLMVTKSIKGNYLNEAYNDFKEEITFRIAFGYKDKDLVNFRIVGVRNAASNIVIDYSQTLKEVNSEDLNPEELNKIFEQIKTVLNDYNNYLSLIGDPQELVEDKEYYKESFLGLFPGKDTKVYNDISPEPDNKLIGAEDYISNYLNNFPDGINNLSINTDSARFGKVIKADDESYHTYVDANKFFSAIYEGEEPYSEMFPLIFKISFNKTGKTYSDFAINSIDISSVNFYEDTPDGVLQKKPGINISPVTRKGWGLTFNSSFGISTISNSNMEELTVENDSVSWNTSSLYGYLGSLGLIYYFSDNLAVRAGFEFNKYSARFNLDGKFTDYNLSSDDNNVLFYKVIEAAYDSLVTINYLNIPLVVNYTSGKPGKLGFYTEGGVKVSIPVNASYKITGAYNYYGDYPSEPFGLRYIDWPEKGFYTKENIEENDKLAVPGINFSLQMGAGVNIPLGYYSSLMLGPELSIGVSDITKVNEPYYDIFGNLHEHEPTKLNYFGIKLSLNYKL